MPRAQGVDRKESTESPKLSTRSPRVRHYPIGQIDTLIRKRAEVHEPRPKVKPDLTSMTPKLENPEALLLESFA